MSTLDLVVSHEVAPATTVNSQNILHGELRLDLLRDETLADLLQASANRLPEQVALIAGEQTLTYQQLNAQADTVAAALHAAGVRPGHIVGLWLPRGIALLVMQAGIAKSGAAWLPFDADTPPERIAICLEDASAFGLLSCAALLDAAGNSATLAPIVWRAEQLSLPVAATLAKAIPRATGQDPAYVIYTSGSTGKPKGIVVNQASICHFLRSENSILGIVASDRVYQGFSVAFDMSFEEIWISYLVGATLWLAPKEVSVDPELLPQELARHHITVLHTVPTMLALFSQDVPSLRIINLGGEACPETLVPRWARPGRQLFNTYGPTEATVSASLAQLQPGEPVTIGRPLPNYGLLIIDAEQQTHLTLLPRGETGELCIIGPGIAAGYLGRPDLSAEKFLPNPWAAAGSSERLYRTGDLARITPEGMVQCLGRADDQVKIRGFRVELGEIEALLTSQPGVGAAAVVLRKEDGIDQLLAFVVPEENVVPLTSAVLRAALTAKLPAYMVPGVFEMLTQMPRLISGKIDRKQLATLPLTHAALDPSESDTPQNDAEQVLFAALNKLFPGQALRRDADFFTDLGGHSLLAARLVSSLRTDARYAYFKISDIYQNRSLARIADALGSTAAAMPEIEADWTPPSSWRRWTCGAAQAAAVPILVALHMMLWLAPFFAYHYFTGEPGDSVARAIAMSVGAFLLLTICEFGIAIAGKWLIAGRLKPGKYPLWGLTYYRWWLADRLVEAAPTYLLTGSSLYSWWLRALGARIGHDVIIGSITLRAPDLLTIGDHVSIGSAANFENARVQRGQLHLGRISLGRDACVGSYSVLEGNVSVGESGHLEGLSALRDGEAVPAGRIWRGSPARDIGAFVATTVRPAVTKRRLAGESVFFLFGAMLVTTLFFMPVFPSFILIDWFDDDKFSWMQTNNVFLQLIKYFVLSFPATAVLIVCTALLSAAVRWTVLPRMKAGSWPIHSRIYCCKWLVNQIQESSLNVLHGVYATIYAPFWYRMLGAKVGRGAEISTALGVVPDMLTLGDESFIADAVLLGDEHIDGGWMRVQPTVISRRSFVGNGAYIPDGTTIPENVLIGVHSSVPAAGAMREGDTWLGSPPIHLPAREEVTGFSERLTFRPSIARRLGRGLVEALRIITPHAIVIAVGYTTVLNLMPAAGDGRWGEVIFYLTLAGLLYGIGTFCFVLILKWVLIRRYSTSSVPMWTPFVWLSEGITNLYEGIAVPNFMRYLRGTPWLPVAFNLLGCHIGKGTYMDTTDLTEFDCVHIGAHSELNALVCPQTHLFEDRVMKIDHVHIGQRVYMGPRSAALYGARVGDGARLGPMTLVMKGEYIPAGSSWRGCPAAVAAV
ncbi:amino acid adenylation domain-containing protein [Herbaspirillum sp. RTI4]|uniref:Pls/PosA family non-ribosomal peptide synthetase n=1 Tax=Herbaspirillum sp. RTI4 TaxID=3048640 RepID=UPI002AB4AC3D|nr:Pls/PosA family non-ribosomal peptide synthetase [Herbaspirillum sp. RTI4]MDY7579641.1 amino acid adenylation domain-containing protein [Herbaspirillum sp. RTI4]MEA9981856.1 amino acid adenylation domain-containing protein [Herbaspirillum sp. RTI4]